jgi:hypothetical protein
MAGRKRAVVNRKRNHTRDLTTEAIGIGRISADIESALCHRSLCRAGVTQFTVMPSPQFLCRRGQRNNSHGRTVGTGAGRPCLD